MPIKNHLLIARRRVALAQYVREVGEQGRPKKAAVMEFAEKHFISERTAYRDLEKYKNDNR